VRHRRLFVCALERIRKQDVKTAKQEAEARRSIRGVEKKPLPHML